MADEPIIVQQVPKTLKDRGVDWVFAQGTTVIVLIAGMVCMGYWVSKEMPARDAAFAKMLQSAEEQHTLENKSLREAHSKELERLERLLTNKINQVQRHSESTERKVDSLMP